MKVTNKLISDLAELAKLRFNKSENEKMKSDFKNMLDFIDKLSEVNTKNIEPLIYLSDEINSLREDNISIKLSKEMALQNLTSSNSDYFTIPKILKK
ncbi:MAG: Asp-tRNA(Asn)/Glu-tRNA(Gln) amidotransferase GatCAB subunit C [Flavobacteriales bacterium]|nr:Asp-tRNA(Asn)/Glu-tRNA(Gln) amidotransferase GatCAB subunit C [Flavobacteriales bacterium]MBH69711.1 Asp-tRNA(Asn)/Glu-tRNA(Gln) amidotransferase GatCAB subunit C [Flavobacteriales bacterium]|tara:strand:- start:14 stop:304 length:291 start_codon:yes stop_codon:yes gene_type:complete